MWYDIVEYLRKEKFFYVGIYLKFGLKNEFDFILFFQDVLREYNLGIFRMVRLTDVRCSLLVCSDGL